LRKGREKKEKKTKKECSLVSRGTDEKKLIKIILSFRKVLIKIILSFRKEINKLFP
jgi:hypothetical protein